MAATKPRAAAARSTTTTKSRAKPAATKPSEAASPDGRFATIGRPAKVLLAALGIAAFVTLTFLVISLVSANDARTNEDPAPANPFSARGTSRDVLTTQRLEALCERYGELKDEHGLALELAPEESIDALARVEAAVPDDAGEASLAFDHLQRAIQLDIEAAAWTAAGSPERAVESYRGAEAEALQADAYASAACQT